MGLQKIGIVFVHGIGVRDARFADKMQQLIMNKVNPECVDVLIMDEVYWADIFQAKQDNLNKYMVEHKLSSFEFLKSHNPIMKIRNFLVSYLADTIGYQVMITERNEYDAVHIRFAKTLNNIANFATDPDGKKGQAPLIIIAHSLGSVITSNYFWDLQHDFQYPELAAAKFSDECKPSQKANKLISEKVRKEIGATPLERGETLTHLITLGSPLALYNMRYEHPDYGIPIQVPSPKLKKHFKQLVDPNLFGASNHRRYWINVYDRDDVIAIPLTDLNACYENMVEDINLEVGGVGKGMTPLSHLEYWEDAEVIRLIVERIEDVWQKVK